MRAILITYEKEAVAGLRLVIIADDHDWSKGPYADTVGFSLGSNQSLIPLEQLSHVKASLEVLESSDTEDYYFMYVGVCPINQAKPRYFGLCCLSSSGYLLSQDGEDTPIEDFGMFICRQTPFKDAEEVFQELIEVLRQQEQKV